MKSGTCPQCGAASVYVRNGGASYLGNSMGVYLNTGHLMMSASTVTSYVCANCGYFENFISDPKKLAEMTGSKDWAKVPSADGAESATMPI